MIKLLLFALLSLAPGQLKPLETASRVAQRVIADTDFTLTEKDYESALFPCVNVEKATVAVERDGEYILGFSGSGKVKLLLDGKVIARNRMVDLPPNEAAYDTYEFNVKIPVELVAGTHTIEFRGSGCAAWGFVLDSGMQDTRVAVSAESLVTGKSRKLTAKKTAAFNKHPYSEWHYANGATLYGMLSLSDALEDSKDNGMNAAQSAAIRSHVEHFCSFTLETMEEFAADYCFEWQLRAQNYRMFRCSMLDDSTGPCLPLVELARRDSAQTDRLKTIIDRMYSYASTEQPRLSDGTFCRPEPRWTVWCDDMFMGGTFLSRYYLLTGEKAAIDDAVRQALLFSKHLTDESTGLLWHGWYDTLGQPLGAHWGRANGWYLWALVSVMDALDEGSAEFEQLKAILCPLLEALCRYQDEDGMWHQVLDHPETYKESSCTALFTAALAHAVRCGWISTEYSSNALRGWEALESRVSVDGVVSGICRSMAIQTSVADYNARVTAGNDPRGLGGFFAAASETYYLIKTL